VDKELYQFATTEWRDFKRLLGPRLIAGIKVYLLRKAGFSYSQIERKLKVSTKTVRYYSAFAHKPSGKPRKGSRTTRGARA